MNDVEKLILSELKELRNEVKDLRSELQIFKGRAYGFLSVVSLLFNVAIGYVTKK